MKIRMAVLAMGAALMLAGCAGMGSGPNAKPEEAARAAYRHNGPPEIVLYTMINNRTDSGAHTALLINAPSQRIIFDPAGSVRFNSVPEIDDVLYGITPTARQFFESAHARSTYRVRIQSRPVSAEVAERAIKIAQANGPVAATMCSTATSGVLRQLPGFGNLTTSMMPSKLAASFAKLPGVTERVLREDDADDKELAITQLQGG